MKNISPTPCLEIRQTGLFDENAASYPWIIEHQGKHYMYYVGWVNGGKSRFQNFTGVAVSDNRGNNFHRVKSTPILDRTDKEPFGSGSRCVFKEGDSWVVYYTAFEPWEDVPGKNRPTYNIKKATSTDLIKWDRNQESVIGFKDEDEYVICKPMIIRTDNEHQLW